MLKHKSYVEHDVFVRLQLFGMYLRVITKGQKLSKAWRKIESVNEKCWIHCGLMTPYSEIDWSTFVQVMGCCLMARSHYFTQCWFLVSAVLWHSPVNNFAASVHATILYDEFENGTFKNIDTSPRGPWVKDSVVRLITRVLLALKEISQRNIRIWTWTSN